MLWSHQVPATAGDAAIQPPPDAGAALAEDPGPIFRIEIPDRRGGNAHRQTQGYDAAGRSSGDQVKVFPERPVQLRLEFSQQSRGVHAPDAATINREYALDQPEPPPSSHNPLWGQGAGVAICSNRMADIRRPHCSVSQGPEWVGCRSPSDPEVLRPGWHRGSARW